MNKRAMIENCVQYILDQDHERDNLLSKLKSQAKDYKTYEGMSNNPIKDRLYAQRPTSIWWQAKCLAHGKRYANNAYRSLLAEVMEAL